MCFGPISEADYMMTGKRADGKDTREMDALNKSAQETVNQSRSKDFVKSAPGMENPGKNRAKPDKKQEKSKKAPVREAVRVVGKDVPSQESPEKDASLQRADMTVHPVITRSVEEKQLQTVISDFRIRSQDYQRQYGTDSVFWIKQKPLYENRYYAQFLMPDGKNTIFVRQADILPGMDAGTGMRLAAVFMDQRYSMMNLEKVNVVAADGSKAIAMFKLPGGAVVAQGSQQPDRKFPALSKKRIWEVLREKAVKRLSKIDDNSANNEILQQKEKALGPPLIPAVGRAPLICILT